MVTLNVRCCCQPTKILGTLEVPDEIMKHGRRLRVIVPLNPENYGERRGRSFESAICADEMIEIREISLGCSLSEFERSMARFAPPSATEFAIYSEERPIEFWRNVRGFREGDAV